MVVKTSFPPLTQADIDRLRQQLGNPSPVPPGTTRHATGGKTGLPSLPKTKGLPPQSVMVQRSAGAGMAHRNGSGFLHSSVPGRTDKLSMNVKNGSYVIPADIVAGHGQGNSLAGAAALDKLFGTKKVSMGRASFPKAKMAQGGHVPVMAAGGEFIVDPEAVAAVGGGDPEKGFRILDAFVLNSRKRQVKTLQNLKPPKKD